VSNNASVRGLGGLRRRNDADPTGAVNSFHDSYTSLGGMITMFNMKLRRNRTRRRGSASTGMLILAIITGCFIAGSDGRTHTGIPRQKITPREIKLAAAYFLITPLIVPDRYRSGDGVGDAANADRCCPGGDAYNTSDSPCGRC